MTGRIVEGVGGLYTVRVEENGEIKKIACRAKGVFRHEGISPLVGDIVSVDLSAGEDNAVIGEIFERENSLIRPPMANLDCVFVAMAAAKPMPMLDMTDKLIAILEHNDIEPVIVIGKGELDPGRAEEIREIYEKAGYRAFVLSCQTGEGVGEIREFISSRRGIMAMAGASGVGKSTLLNRLFPTLELSTGGVSRKTERGRHTTRAVTLYDLGDGLFFADTPGFSMLDFERFDFFDVEDLPLAFKEINERIGECKYTKCTHLREDGCAIVEAVKRGEISKSRHDSYVSLYEILKNKHKWDK
ncbi:MAG: ribosome small subunit-dependent GTPase A [Ruminococcaceae bacterium]|nr:ribosome small subunit-dependent GTPase A [Oscillospiraceae bacterium]